MNFSFESYEDESHSALLAFFKSSNTLLNLFRDFLVGSELRLKVYFGRRDRTFSWYCSCLNMTATQLPLSGDRVNLSGSFLRVKISLKTLADVVRTWFGRPRYVIDFSSYQAHLTNEESRVALLSSSKDPSSWYFDGGNGRLEAITSIKFFSKPLRSYADSYFEERLKAHLFFREPGWVIRRYLNEQMAEFSTMLKLAVWSTSDVFLNDRNP